MITARDRWSLVVYAPPHGSPELGVLTEIRGDMGMVRYFSPAAGRFDDTSKATCLRDLRKGPLTRLWWFDDLTGRVVMRSNGLAR